MLESREEGLDAECRGSEVKTELRLRMKFIADYKFIMLLMLRDRVRLSIASAAKWFSIVGNIQMFAVAVSAHPHNPSLSHAQWR